jgi:hypothetical protein
MMTVIQTKLRIVIRNMKSRTIPEFQHDGESQSIQDLNVKMPSIQFVSILMQIQMKLITAICNPKNMMSQEFQLDMELQLS